MPILSERSGSGSGFSILRRQEAEREEATRLERAVLLEALDGVISFARREQLSMRLTDDEAALLAGLAVEGRSTHTLRALAGDLETLALWHRRDETTSLPLPTEDHVLRFIETRRSSVPAPSHATVKRQVTSWTTLTRAAGGDSMVFASAVIRTALAGQKPARAKVTPLGEDGLALLLASCHGSDLTDCRDRALLITAFSLDLRPAEITALRVKHLTGGKAPRLAIPLASDHGGTPSTRIVPLPAAVFTALNLWRKQAGLTDGPLFRPVDRWGKPGRLGITSQSITLIVRARAKAAGLDPAAFSARSLR